MHGLPDKESRVGRRWDPLHISEEELEPTILPALQPGCGDVVQGAGLGITGGCQGRQRSRNHDRPPFRDEAR